MVSVDDRFARFGGKSYAINKINSVEVRSVTRKGSTTYVIWWMIAVILVLGALGQHMAGLLVLAALAAVIGIPSFRGRHAVTNHRLYLVTSSSEAQAFETTDWEQMSRLRRAIEEAMSRSS